MVLFLMIFLPSMLKIFYKKVKKTLNASFLKSILVHYMKRSENMQNKLLLFYQKYSKTFFDIALISITVYLFMWLGSYVYQLTFPILLAFLIAAMVRPVSAFLHRKGMKKNHAITLTMGVFVLLLLGVVFAAGALIVAQVFSLYHNMPGYIDFFKGQVFSRADIMQNVLDKIPADVLAKANEYVEVMTGKITSILTAGLYDLLGMITSFSSFVINFVIAIMLAYFLCLEIEDWKEIANKKTPKTFKNAFVFLKDNVFSGIGKYLIAQLKLISITFTIILVGLLIIRADNALTIAFFSAIFDLVPLLGVPVIFIPWIIYAYVTGNTTLAIGLLVVMLVAIIARQVFEPRIAGEALGVSPFLMLASTIVFMEIFGISAVFLTPLILILIKQLYDKGYIQSWIRKPENEYDEVIEEEEKENEN